MYLAYYGLTEKPFQLKPDPNFYFGSKGHKRAAAYLEYGLSQEDGFIIITGEVGAGKTTLMRHLFQKIAQERIVAAQLVSTRLDPDDVLRMVSAAFGLAYENLSKATLLLELEEFMRQRDREGKRVLLVVDEAQNLSPQTLEELRMLSNFQTDDRPLLQTFLLGQPEFRRTLLGSQMQQLRQRVIATYHLGPLDLAETRSYIEHRLQKAGWTGKPSFQDGIFEIIHNFSGGIPRRINMFCDRLLIMGCLEELQSLGRSEANEVMLDIQKEFDITAFPEKIE
jgi:general secretion pathway protein A